MMLFEHLDWDFISSCSRTQDWRTVALEKFLSHCKGILSDSLDVPDVPGGWMHQFICPQHWNPLTYVSASSRGFACSHGHMLASPDISAAWRALRHRELADMSRDLALGACLYEDSRFFDGAVSILSSYAEKYSYFNAGNTAQLWMLRGKVFHQALTEALWAVSIIYAFDFLQSNMDSKKRDFIIRNLLIPIANTISAAHQELIEQDKVESNYTAWLNAVLGLLGIVLNREDLLKRALLGSGGFYRHMELAVRNDGFEYEGTTYYHNFVLLAYCILAEACISKGIDLYSFCLSQSKSIKGMWDSIVAIAYPDGSLPALNDGAYWVGGTYWKGSPFDMELCHVLEIAFYRTGDARYAWLLKKAYERRKMERKEWFAILYGRRKLENQDYIHAASSVLDDSGVAVLRNPDNDMAVLAVFGPDGGSHTHHDRLSVSLWPWSKDPGTLPYGGISRKAWYQTGFAHNGVIINGCSQSIPAKKQKFSYGDRFIFMASSELYENTTITRRVILDSDLVSDGVIISCKAESVIDWILNVDGVLFCDDFRPPDTQISLYHKPANDFISVLAMTEPLLSLDVHVTYGNRSYLISLRASSPVTAFVVEVPGLCETPTISREALIVRAICNRLRIDADIRRENYE